MVNHDFDLRDMLYFVEKNTKQIGITLAIIGALAFGGYFYYQNNLEQESLGQAAFAECMQEYHNAHKNPELWSEVEIACKTGFRQYGSTSMAPYFLTLQAYCATQQHKSQEALDTLDSALKLVSQSNPFYYNIKLKRALIVLDMNEPEAHELGLKQLKEVAYDKNNDQRDQALYELINYYFMQGDVQNAQVVSKELQAFPDKPGLGASPWKAAAHDMVVEAAA